MKSKLSKTKNKKTKKSKLVEDFDKNETFAECNIKQEPPVEFVLMLPNYVNI